jgi:hypothetical protein
MSTAADLILADVADATQILASDYALGLFKGVNVDGLDPLKVAALHSLLLRRDFGEVLRGYQPLGQASPQGPWLVRLPDELLEGLSHIAPPDQPSVAAQWATTEQASEAGWSQEDADGFLGRLLPFAATARFENRALFLWVYD